LGGPCDRVKARARLAPNERFDFARVEPFELCRAGELGRAAERCSSTARAPFARRAISSGRGSGSIARWDKKLFGYVTLEGRTARGGRGRQSSLRSIGVRERLEPRLESSSRSKN